MTKQKIIEKTNVALAEEFEKDPSLFDPQESLREALELDSLALVDLVALLESEFGYKIKGPEIIEVKTFEDLYEFLLKKQSDEGHLAS